MPCDKGKATRIKTCNKVSVKERNKYRMEEEAAQNNSKRSRVESESPHRMFGSGSGSSSTHGSGFLPMRKTLSDFLDLGCRDDVDSKVYRFLYACGVHSMFFAHPIGMKWYKPSMVPLKDTGALGMTKLEMWDLIGKEPKSIVLLENLQMIGPIMGYPLYLMGGKMLKASH